MVTVRRAPLDKFITRKTHPYRPPPEFEAAARRFFAHTNIPASQIDRYIKFTLTWQAPSLDPSYCWPWLSKISSGSVPRFWINGHWMTAWDFGYQLRVGNVPEGLVARPICATPLCMHHGHLRCRRHQRRIGKPLSAGEEQAVTDLLTMWPLHGELDNEQTIAAAYGVAAREITALWSTN